MAEASQEKERRAREDPRRSPIAFWLIPAAPDHAELTVRMTELARRHEAPRFEPHVTLHVDTAAADCDVTALLATVAATVAPISLQAGATGHSAHYFRTLFIDFTAASANVHDGIDAIGVLQHRLATALWSTGGTAGDRHDREAADKAIARYPLEPHLSLLYARLDEAQRAALAEDAGFAGRRLRFDTLAAVRPAPGFSDMAEVARWDVFGHCQLRGPSVG